MKTEKSIQLLSNNRKLIAGLCKKQFFLSFYLFCYIHTPVPPLSQANQSDGNRVAREVGYDDEFSAAVTMTSSVQGMLIPPSHNMIIYAMAAGGLSVSALFMAGIVPGILLGVALMIFSFYLSVKRNYPKGNPFSVRTLVKAIGKSIWGLGTVMIVVVGVVPGVHSRPAHHDDRSDAPHTRRSSLFRPDDHARCDHPGSGVPQCRISDLRRGQTPCVSPAQPHRF